MSPSARCDQPYCGATAASARIARPGVALPSGSSHWSHRADSKAGRYWPSWWLRSRRRRAGAFAGLVDIGGRRLYMECQGTGSPTVVLEAGGYARGDYWTRDLHEPAGRRQMVLPAVAGFTRVCTYDRPGTVSDPDPGADPGG